MQRQTCLGIAVIMLAMSQGTARAQWVVPCDPLAPRGFSCWPAPTLFDRPRFVELSEEEQEQELVYIQEKEFQAPPPQLHVSPSLAEMALMSNYPQPIIMQVFYAEDPNPVHRHRSFTEWRLDCQDRVERHCHMLVQGISSARLRLGSERSSCPCPE